MERVILIKYGELTTKKGNRNFFIRTLINNIKHKLDGFDCQIYNDLSRMEITFSESELDKVLNIINSVFGIHSYQVAYKITSDIELIKEKVLSVIKLEKFSTFKVETKRSDKKFSLDSMEVSRKIGGHILKNMDNVSVDVHTPDLLCTIEIKHDYTYIYTNKQKGSGGYPVGSQPRSLLMLSGGIDSPVAGYLAMKRGIKIDCVYFEAIPHTSLEARNKVIKLVKKLVKYTNKINLHIIPFTKLQEEIYANCDSSYAITIMRRMMYRIMTELCHKYKALAIINGESVGQVASQTLTSMNVINSVTSTPVIRPVACLDKLEIIDISKKIDTYDISILPFEDCCTIFVPKHPVINPNLEICINYESKFDYNSLIKEIMDNIYTMSIRDTDKIEEEFEELL